MNRAISKPVRRYTSQEVCPFNVKFSEALTPDSPYAARESLGCKDARALARELLGMTHEEFSRAFSKSPMKRAKLRGLRRNAAVVLANVGTADRRWSERRAPVRLGLSREAHRECCAVCRR